MTVCFFTVLHDVETQSLEGFLAPERRDQRDRAQDYKRKD
jgi:hypothetical protein